MVATPSRSSVLASLRENAELIERWNGHDGGRIRCDWAPHAPDTCSDDLLREVSRLAERHGGNIHTHLCQLPLEVENRGYIGMGSETLARLAGQETPPDYKEVFTIGPIDVSDQPYYTAAAAYPAFAPNLWPSVPEGLKPAMSAYWHSISALAERVLGIGALALDLPRDFFVSLTDRHISMLRLICYPPYLSPPATGQLRAGIHTDLNMLTFVHANSDEGGLEVRARDGSWLAPKASGDAYIVNVGDILMRWTNDRWVSTPHRVANPPTGWGERRLSVPFFFQANYDTVVECLPSCAVVGQAPKYQPISVGAYRAERFARTAT